MSSLRFQVFYVIIITSLLEQVAMLPGNIVEGKVARAANIYEDYLPRYAIDGDTNPLMSDMSCFQHGRTTGNAWWMLDLISLHVIMEVTVYGVKDSKTFTYVFLTKQLNETIRKPFEALITMNKYNYNHLTSQLPMVSCVPTDSLRCFAFAFKLNQTMFKSCVARVAWYRFLCTRRIK